MVQTVGPDAVVHAPSPRSKSAAHKNLLAPISHRLFTRLVTGTLDIHLIHMRRSANYTLDWLEAVRQDIQNHTNQRWEDSDNARQDDRLELGIHCPMVRYSCCCLETTRTSHRTDTKPQSAHDNLLPEQPGTWHTAVALRSQGRDWSPEPPHRWCRRRKYIHDWQNKL